jgi:hypothetical protein
MAYTPYDHDFARDMARDAHLSPDEIETRRMGQLLALLDAWHGGEAETWDVLRDLAYIMDIWAFSKLTEPRQGGHFRKSPEQAQEEFRPYMVPAFLKSPLPESACAEIAAFIKRIEDSDTETSFSVAKSIITAIIPIPEEAFAAEIAEDMAWSSPYISRDRAFASHPAYAPLLRLAEMEERDQEERRKKNPGTLSSYPEEKMRARLAPYIAELREAVPSPVPIKSIEAHATGSAVITPHYFNPDFLPDNDWNGERHEFSQYEYPEESLAEYYGTIIARITTYGVSFIPENPEDLDKLHTQIQEAIKLLGKIPPAFGIPTDNDVGMDYYEGNRESYDADGGNEGWFTSRKPYYKRPNPYGKFCAVDVSRESGKISVRTRLDLDDLYTLYYLLENSITPTVEIAQVLNAARYAEARSAPMRKEDIPSAYGNEHMGLADRLGNLEHTNPQGVPETMLTTTFKMFAAGKVSEEDLLRQTMLVADQTLSGRIGHPALPSFGALQTLGEKAGLPATYQGALKERTTDLLHIMARLPENSDAPVIRALHQRAVAEKDAVIAELQGEIEQGYRDAEARSARRAGKGFDPQDFLVKVKDIEAEHKKAETISDALSGYATRKFQIDADEAYSRFHQACENDPDPYACAGRLMKEWKEKREKSLAPRIGLVEKDPEIATCMDRVYDDTIYTSRMKNSPWPRHELPAALQRFINPQADPAGQVHLLLADFQGPKV